MNKHFLVRELPAVQLEDGKILIFNPFQKSVIGCRAKDISQNLSFLDPYTGKIGAHEFDHSYWALFIKWR